MKRFWVVLAACLCWGQAVQAMPCNGAADMAWRALAPGIWVWEGANEEPSPTNRGHIAPTTAVLADGRALLIDPGPSTRHAQAVVRTLRCRFGAQVSDVINTHAHAENVLGNGAFAEAAQRGDVRIWASEGTREGMRQRCPDCLQSLTTRIGAVTLSDTRIALPSHRLSEGDVLQHGPHRLQVLRVEQGHTDADLVLWLPKAGVLWAGGLVYDGRLPEMAQGTLDGWLGALQRLAALQPRVVVGSRVGGPDMLAATQRYLTVLRERVLAAMDAGRLAGERHVVPMAEWADWAGHARQDFNTQRAWRELEPVWMSEPPRR